MQLQISISDSNSRNHGQAFSFAEVKVSLENQGKWTLCVDTLCEDLFEFCKCEVEGSLDANFFITCNNLNQNFTQKTSWALTNKSKTWLSFPSGIF